MPTSKSFSAAIVLSCVTLMLAAGCVNLDTRDPSPFRRGQKTENGQTVGTRAATKKSVSKMKDSVKPSSVAAKVKGAWPFHRKTRTTVSQQPLADDDPTRLDFMPKNVGSDLYIAAARMSEKSGNYPQAVQQYNTALKSDRQDRNALIGLARLHHRSGKTSEAIRVYREALNFHQNDAVILNDLGICYARENQTDEAIRVLEAATKADPKREMYVNNLAAALVDANRSDEARAKLATLRGPAVANYNVGYLLDQSGRKQEAAGYLSQALKIDPDLQQARRLLNSLSPRMSSLPSRVRAEN